MDTKAHQIAITLDKSAIGITLALSFTECPMPANRLVTTIFTLVSLAATSALSHEFWLEPLDWQVPAGAELTAHAINGQEFSGNRQPYLPSRIAQFNLYSAERATRIENRTGNTPALQTPAHGDGLHVAAYQSTFATLTYTEWEKFVAFAEHKDLGDVAALHDARGLSRDVFTEVYTRFSKTLFGVGSAAGADRRVGFETEIVALTNPYTDAGNGTVQVQLFYQSSPRADAQIEIFDRAPEGGVTISLIRTDANGIANIPVRAGHDYMLDAVVLREPSARLRGLANASWETLWANLTFHVP